MYIFFIILISFLLVVILVEDELTENEIIV